ncbi:hypothetical protein [Phocaeicola sp.]
MKRIFTILVCVLAIVGATSCGNGSSNKQDETEQISEKDLKKLEKLAKSVKVAVEIKGNDVIHTSKAFGMICTVIYTFEGNKCVGQQQIWEYPDEKTTKEYYEMMKDLEGCASVKLNGKKLTCVYKPVVYEWLTEQGMTKEQFRDKLQKEIDKSK